MKEWCRKQCNNFGTYIKYKLKYYLELFFQKEGWGYIIISFAGSFFPIWLNFFINYAEGNPFKKSFCLACDIYSVLIIATSFASMTIYLLSKKKLNWLLLFYSIILFPIIGFLVSKKNKIDISSGQYSSFIIIISLFIFVVYIWSQLEDFLKIKKEKQAAEHTEPNKVSAENQMKLDVELNDLDLDKE